MCRVLRGISIKVISLTGVGTPGQCLITIPLYIYIYYIYCIHIPLHTDEMNAINDTGHRRDKFSFPKCYVILQLPVLRCIIILKANMGEL